MLQATSDGFSGEIEKEGVKFIPIKTLNRKGTNPFEDVKLFLSYAVYTEEKPSLSAFHRQPNIYGAIASRFMNIPSVCSITGLGYSL